MEKGTDLLKEARLMCIDSSRASKMTKADLVKMVKTCVCVIERMESEMRTLSRNIIDAGSYHNRCRGILKQYDMFA